ARAFAWRRILPRLKPRRSNVRARAASTSAGAQRILECDGRVLSGTSGRFQHRTTLLQPGALVLQDGGVPRDRAERRLDDAQTRFDGIEARLRLLAVQLGIQLQLAVAQLEVLHGVDDGHRRAQEDQNAEDGLESFRNDGELRWIHISTYAS